MKNLEDQIRLAKTHLNILKQTNAPPQLIAMEEDYLKTMEELAATCDPQETKVEEVKVVVMSLEDLIGAAMQAAAEERFGKPDEEP